MKEFSAYIDFCYQQYQGIAKCGSCPYGQCIHDCKDTPGHDCYNCLYKIHRYSNRILKYQCERIIYNYVLKHGHRYASEIDKELALLKNIMPAKNELNVCSIGCGPCTELFGVIRQFNYSVIHFKGFDRDAIWSPITAYQKTLFPTTDIQFPSADFFDYMNANDEHVDLLILNYMLSDLARYETAADCSAFLDGIITLCEQKRISYIVINDVYLCYSSRTGYALMEELARKLMFNKNVNEKIGRGRFEKPSQSPVVYGKRKYPEGLSFPITEQGINALNPFPICKSLFMFVLIQ